MATTTLDRPWLSQPNWRPEVPDPKTLDPRQMAFIYDADMDELTILFYGKDRRHSVHPVTDVGSALIDSTTGDVVGVTYSRFFKALIPRDPKLATVLLFTEAIPAGDTEESPEAIPSLPGEEQRPRSGIWERLVAAYRAFRDGVPDSVAEQKRRSLQRLPSFC